MSLKLAIIGDIHFPQFSSDQTAVKQARDEFYGQVLRNFLSYKADFHIALGDVTHNGHEAEWTELLQTISQAHPGDAAQTFRFILGNHDTLFASKSRVEEVTGRKRFYVEETAECRLVFLDTTKETSPQDWGGIVDQEQLAWLESLQSGPEKTTIVFGHHPFPNSTTGSDESMMRLANANELFPILEKLSATGVYFNGHNHVQSIVDTQDEFPGWSFIQSSAILSSGSFRVVEITPTHIHVDTIHLMDQELNTLATATRSGMTDYFHHEFAHGAQRDQFVVLPRWLPKQTTMENN